MTDSPLFWAAYAVSAANQLDAAERVAFKDTALSAPDSLVAPRTRETLARAVKTMREMHARRLSSADVLAEYLDTETTVTEGPAWRELGVALALPILGRLASRREGATPVGDLAATDELLSCLRGAVAEAELEGRPLEIEHVIRVASREASAARRMLATLDATRIQRRSQIANLVDNNLAEQLVRPHRTITPPGTRVTEHLLFVDALLDEVREPEDTKSARPLALVR
jgi:hypothetical protein